MQKKKLISLEMSEELISKLKKEAEKQEISMSALIRNILKAYFKDNDSL